MQLSMQVLNLFEGGLQGRITDELKIEGILNRHARYTTIPMVGTQSARKRLLGCSLYENNTRKELDMKNTT